MKVLRFLMTLMLAVIFTVGNCSAMKFSQPVEIGKIGYPRQAPIHGYIMNNATKNDGTYYKEKPSKTNGIEENFKTYVKGVAQFGQGDSALYCNYNFNEDCIKFGGKNNYILTSDGSYKDIYKIDSDSGVVLYALHYHYTTTRLNIIGRQKDGKWVSFIDSKKISDMYFDGKDAYNLPEGVLYEKPTCKGDTIVIPYCRLRSFRTMEGEIRLKWDEKAQWFGIEKVVY